MQDYDFMGHDPNAQSPLDSFPEIQNLFETLLGASSGTTAPATTWPGQLWFDTATPALKIRNAGDTAWRTLFDLSGSVPKVLDADKVDGQEASAFAPASHTTNTSNPHGVTAAQVSLGSVINKALQFKKNGGAARNATWDFNTSTGVLNITTSA